MELFLPPIKYDRNLVNGRFLEGHIPYNKGKKWKDYMDMRKAKKVLRIGKNNLQPKHKNRSSKSIIGIKDGKIIGIFNNSVEAMKKMNIKSENIRRCCKGERKTAGKIQWFYEKTNTWCELINNIR